jgi:hypothetical protein
LMIMGQMIILKVYNSVRHFRGWVDMLKFSA